MSSKRVGGGQGHLGGKADGLRWLVAHGYEIPPTFVIPWRSRPYAPHELAGIVATECLPGRRYAVRSSANVEDTPGHSFAGQFRTELDVPRDEVRGAVERVLASVRSGPVVAYLEESQIDPAGIQMAVVVQEMVDAVAAGVAFSRNPMTGLNEVVVEAVAGRGDSLVDGGVTPARWVFHWGDPVEEPEPPPLPATAVRDIARHVAAMAGEYGQPIDVEWAWDGSTLSWLQVRPITGLEEVPLYSNRISREVLPGIIKPLVWSVNVPAVNSAWIDLFTEAVGPTELRPEDLAASFAYRAYFNMGTIGRIFEQLGMPRDSLELLLGLPKGSDQPGFAPTPRTLRLLPRMAAVARSKWRYEADLLEVLPSLEERFDSIARIDPTSLDDAALLGLVDELRTAVREAAYANIVTPLLMNTYGAMLSTILRRRGIDGTSIDVTAGMGELARFDPTVHLDSLHGVYVGLPPEVREALDRDGVAALESGHPFRVEFDAFLARFGHFSDSGNDFSAVPWREDPGQVLDLVRSHVPGRPDNERLSWEDVAPTLRGPVAIAARGLYGRARRFRRHREVVSYHYTHGYGLFRDLFRELGRRLADRGAVAEPDDVFYLTFAEVEEAIVSGLPDAADRVAGRRAEIESVRDVVLPEVIFGDRFVPMPSGAAIAGVLRGIPTSRGVYRGTARVVRGRDEFGTLGEGDVLVMPFSDVGWTPLFARAGAVVAEAGGMLSHSSIVAREYGVPCVVSVNGATRIENGAEVIVDGYSGTVTVVAGEVKPGSDRS